MRCLLIPSVEMRVFVQTLLYNSEFRNNAKDLNDEYNGCMREIAWEHITKSNDPWHNFHLSNLQYLLASDKWFALKFESDDGMELVQRIEEEPQKMKLNRTEKRYKKYFFGE